MEVGLTMERQPRTPRHKSMYLCPKCNVYTRYSRIYKTHLCKECNSIYRDIKYEPYDRSMIK